MSDNEEMILREDMQNEFFSVDLHNSEYTNKVISGGILKEGTSYSEHMLDLNELMEKEVLHRGNKVDLSGLPEIETLQAASQEQLDMLTPESKKQITAIHLSNNTPVGWDDNYDFQNKYEMDKNLDLSAYENVTEVQTHFYVNNDLEDIILPPNVSEVLCRHSKMEKLREDGGLKGVEVNLDRAQTSFGFDDGYVDEYEEEERIWQYAEDYFENGNIGNIQTFKEQGGFMIKFLQSAIERGKLKFVQDAIENGADVNGCSASYNGVPVCPALVEASLQVARHNEFRKKHQRDIYGVDISREEPEQIAERRKIVEYLINQGARLEKIEGFISPLEAVCGVNGFKDYEVFKMLAKAGAPLTAKEAEFAKYDSKLFRIMIENGYKPTAEEAIVAKIDYLKWKGDALRERLGSKVGKTADVKTGKVSDEHRKTAETQVEISRAIMEAKREKEEKGS